MYATFRLQNLRLEISDWSMKGAYCVVDICIQEVGIEIVWEVMLRSLGHVSLSTSIFDVGTLSYSTLISEAASVFRLG